MQAIKNAVEKHSQLILDAERYIWQHPETGYKEYETSKYMEEIFESLGYELVRAGNIPGFYTVIDTGKPGPEILIFGEMDSIICPTHPECNPETGAAHSCAHHAQCATLIGIAAALKEPGVIDDLCGKIKLCAVPAEELLEIEFRSELKKKGIIKYFGGKSEFMHRGYFDTTDIAFMVHTSGFFGATLGSVGCMAKKVTYKGKSAHAGGSPWDGKNALYAATCGINAINAIRENFKEDDIIRVHPIITDGGQMVNAIPATTTLESYVRGKTFDGIVAANKRVNQALVGAALSINANVDIEDFPGYAPLINDPNMISLAQDAAKLIIPHQTFEFRNRTGSGSTDMGELSCVMPVVHPYAGGRSGTSHGADIQIVDPVAACVDSAKWQLAMLKLLLENNGERAYKIKKDFKPLFPSIKEFLAYSDSLCDSGDRITYNEDNTVNVRL